MSTRQTEFMPLIVAVAETLVGRRSPHIIASRTPRALLHSIAAFHRGNRFSGASIATIKTQMPAPGAVEASVRLLLGGRSTAAAIRLDHDGQWLCTDARLAV